MFHMGGAMADGLEVGKPAPDFTLMDQTGQPVSLHDFKGKWVVLYFYPKDDTPGCTKEACSFRDNIRSLIAQNAVVLGVSVDDQQSHQDFEKKYELPFKLLSDPKGEVAKQYGSLLNLFLFKIAKRHSFIIDPNGNLAKIYRSVSPDDHVTEILRDLKQLQSKTES